jgi:Xaa-Pro aminopeptidase
VNHDPLSSAVEIGRALNAPLPRIDVTHRGERLTALFATAARESSPIDAFVTSSWANVAWLTGFTGSSATVIVRVDGSVVLITDGRYAERAESELHAAGSRAEVLIGRTQKLQNEILETQLRGSQTVGLEASHISWSRVDEIRTLLAEHQDSRDVAATIGLVESLRRTKTPAEVALTARAGAIADAALLGIVELMGSGITERGVARAFADAVLDLGADDISFETIIASGPNGSRPHHGTADRVIEDGDMVICDLGALVGGYHSDMTRTILVGDVSSAQRRHFDVVKRSHAAGVGAIAAGVEAKDVDAACRSVIADVGWVEHFVHGTGHGTGLMIHEAPWINANSTDVLGIGDLLTIEPGVYLPGNGGVRIEDLLVLTENGPVAVTQAPYELVVAV